MAEESGKIEISGNTDPEALAKGIEVAGEMEKVGFSPLNPIAQRFPIEGSADSFKTTEGRLEEVASTPADKLLESSEWRRNLSSSDREQSALDPQVPALENQQAPESQEALSRATKVVLGLYLGDKVSILLGTQGAEMRDEIWTKATPELGIYADKAKELRSAMKVVAETKKAYPPQIESISKIPFVNLEDRVATEYLSDMLFSRMIKSQGYLDYDINMVDVSDLMATEMGIMEGWRSEQAKEVTLENAIGATLEGKLKITHQPNVDTEEATRIVTKIEIDKALGKAQQPKTEPKV